MAIQNNTSLPTNPIPIGKSTTARKPAVSANTDIAPVAKKAKSADFSMVLSQKQKESIDQTLGYDEPSFKQRGALDAYQQVSVQQKREEIIDSMSFHFVV